MSGVLQVRRAGNSQVTDLGRFRGPRFGLPVNGALDQWSARAANILAGNDDDAALVEITALDFTAATTSDLLIAVTGSPATVRVGGRPVRQWEPVSVRAGETIRVTGITGGLRTYLAVHGSLGAPRLLGSCAPDTVIGFGLRLADGHEVATLASVRPIRQPYFDLPLFRLGPRRPDFTAPRTVCVTDGPDVDEFGDSAHLLFEAPYVVSARSNHIGLRLGGELPERQSSGEVLSRGVPVGAVEVPSRDELLVLHRGRGVTAGYPVLAVVTSLSLDTLAQARPGDAVIFRKTGTAEAAAALRAARAELDTLRRTVNTVFSALGVAARADNDPAAHVAAGA
ncbi:biotin-dependent carboxyltransferase family protein [Specibacter cremeus]|uniref:5-oxoprolinase subunit C family protein n=1 Tax=Specibacter cremeus TaxID=1629051 RepID=UPI000F7827A1|nr:biotin-dependent carboxyltransferase family protein [Specibacter cremeus]